MKRTLMILVAILALTTAHADDYPYLTFETQDGTTPLPPRLPALTN